MKPTIGRIVHYTLTEGDAHAIRQQRAALVQAHGNPVQEGQVYPAMVVRVFDPSTAAANLQVFLDGNDSHWATSAKEGHGPGHWAWPSRD